MSWVSATLERGLLEDVVDTLRAVREMCIERFQHALEMRRDLH